MSIRTRLAGVAAFFLLAACGEGPETVATSEEALTEGAPALAQTTAAIVPQLRARAAAHGFSQDDVFVLREAPSMDELGAVIARFDREHAGMPVIGGDVLVHAKLEVGLPVTRVISRVPVSLASIPRTPKVSAQAASALAKSLHPDGDPEGATLVLFAGTAHRAQPRLAWSVEIGPLDVIVDAETGARLTELGHVVAACAGGPCEPASITVRPFYTEGPVTVMASRRSRLSLFFPWEYLLESEGRIRVDDSTITRAQADEPREIVLGLWFAVDTAGVPASSLSSIFGNHQMFDGRDAETALDRRTALGEAYYNLDRTWTYFRARFNRRGFTGVTSICPGPPPTYFRMCLTPSEQVIATFGYPGGGNAFYHSDTDEIAFAYDGRPAPTTGPFVELDIVAHEFGHGVTHHTAALLAERGSESAALNESISDVFGRTAVFHHDDAVLDGPHPWHVGHGVRTPENPDDIGFRIMDRPSLDGVSIEHIDDFVVGETEEHVGAGVGNRVFAYVANEVGWEVALRVWYRALTTCFTSAMTHRDARVCTVEAARALYPRTGTTSFIDSVVNTAWGIVGVF